MKKTIIVLLTVLLLASWVYAGGGSQQSSGGGASTSTLLVDDRSKTLDLTWWGFNNPGILPHNGSVVQREMERRYNIRITNIPVDNYNAEQGNLLIATGVQCDVWLATTGIAAAQNGLLRPLPMELMTRFAPNIVRILNNESREWTKTGSVDGVLYGFPSLSFDQTSPYGLVVRTDWLRNLGVTTLPTTLDELEALMVRFRNDDPDGNGRRDTYGLSMSEGNGGINFVNPYLFATYGVQPNRWTVDTDGSPKWFALDDNYRQALIKLSEWWAKEIYDPSLVVNASRADNWNRIANGVVAGTFGTDWQQTPRANPVANAWDLLLQNNPNLDAATVTTLIPPVRGPNGVRTHQFNTPIQVGFSAFGRNTSDEKIARVLSMLDDIVSQRDLYLLVSYGIEGQHWDFNEDKRPLVRPEWNSPEKLTEIGGNRYKLSQFLPFEFADIAYNSARFTQFEAMRNWTTLPLHFMQFIPVPEETEFGAATSRIASEYFWKTFTGEWDVNSTWNDYTNRWRAAGGQQILDAKKKLAREL